MDDTKQKDIIQIKPSDFSIQTKDKTKYLVLKVKQKIPDKTIFSKKKDFELVSNSICEKIDFFNLIKGAENNTSVEMMFLFDQFLAYLKPIVILSTPLMFLRLRRKHSPKWVKPFLLTFLYAVIGN